MRFPKKLTCLYFSLLTLGFNANASNLIFKCDTKNHKQINLLKDADNVIYSFGKIGENPEIELTRKKTTT